MNKVISLSGKSKEEIELPNQFNENYRPDLIKRAVLSIRSKRIKPEGVKKDAGIRHAAELSKRRESFKTTFGYGQSRTPRKTMARIGSRFTMEGANAPNTVGGRKSHPSKVERNRAEKINKKEKRKAIRSAISSTKLNKVIKSRGHKIENLKELPIIAEEKIEGIKKTKDVLGFLKKLGLNEEISRTKEKKIKAGKGKSRGRKYKKKKGPLFVVSKKCDLMNSAKNIAGVDVCQVKNLNAELLAPGTDAGRLVIWSKSSIELLKEKKLFM